MRNVKNWRELIHSVCLGEEDSSAWFGSEICMKELLFSAMKWQFGNILARQSSKTTESNNPNHSVNYEGSSHRIGPCGLPWRDLDAHLNRRSLWIPQIPL